MGTAFGIAAVLFASTGLAQGLLKMPVLYPVPAMSAVQVTRGLVYRTDAGVSLPMDVYRPPNLQKSENRPAVLFLHGGADISKSPTPIEWGVYQSYGRLMGASGLIGVTFNQRIGDPQDGLQKGFGDVRAAIEYVRSHAADVQVNPDRLCLAAYSAGGPLLAIGIGDPQPYIRCLVASMRCSTYGHPYRQSGRPSRRSNNSSCMRTSCRRSSWRVRARIRRV